MQSAHLPLGPVRFQHTINTHRSIIINGSDFPLLPQIRQNSLKFVQIRPSSLKFGGCTKLRAFGSSWLRVGA